MGDFIKTLPTDTTMSSANELNIVNTLFEQQKKQVKQIFSGVKDVVIAGILFFIMSLPFVNNLLGSCLNFVNTSPLLATVIKTVVFMVLFFFAQNFILSRK